MPCAEVEVFYCLLGEPAGMDVLLDGGIFIREEIGGVGEILRFGHFRGIFVAHPHPSIVHPQSFPHTLHPHPSPFLSHPSHPKHSLPKLPPVPFPLTPETLVQSVLFLDSAGVEIGGVVIVGFGADRTVL